MGKGLEQRPYSPEQRAAIVDRLARFSTPQSYYDIGWMLGDIRRVTGRIVDFAEIETISRETELSIALLAVDVRYMRDTHKLSGMVIVVNPDNSMDSDKLDKQLPYQVVFCESVEDRERKITEFEIDDFAPEVNLERLKRAGIPYRLGN